MRAARVLCGPEGALAFDGAQTKAPLVAYRRQACPLPHGEYRRPVLSNPGTLLSLDILENITAPVPGITC